LEAKPNKNIHESERLLARGQIQGAQMGVLCLFPRASDLRHLRPGVEAAQYIFL